MFFKSNNGPKFYPSICTILATITIFSRKTLGLVHPVWFSLRTPSLIYYCCLSKMSHERESEQRLVTVLVWFGSCESDNDPGLFIKKRLPHKRCDLDIKGAICEQIAPMGASQISRNTSDLLHPKWM